MSLQEMRTGDSLVILRGMPAESIKVTITSPPYNLGVNYGVYHDKRQHSSYLEWMHSIFHEVCRTLAQDGHFFLQVGGTPLHPHIPEELLHEALDYFALQNTIVWIKALAVGGVSHGHYKPINSPRFLNNTFELIYHLTRTGKSPIDRLAVGVPYTDRSNTRRWKQHQEKHCAGNCWFIPYDTIQSGDERMKHPAVFPKELAKRCILLSGASSDDLICDPFAGIGTTLLAARDLGLNALGIDIDPQYVDFANQTLGVASNA